MKLEEVPSTAQPFITVANHNYDQKATPERTFSFAALYQFRQKHYERSIIQAYSLEVFSLFFFMIKVMNYLSVHVELLSRPLSGCVCVFFVFGKGGSSIK